MTNLEHYREIMITASDHEVYVDWTLERNGVYWNEVCASIIEVFGLPGGKYQSNATTDFMVFTFKSKKDAALCRILISEDL